MKKSILLACLLSAMAMSSFAQSAPPMTPAEAGAKRVAERDAEWARTHSGGTAVKEPVAPRYNAKHVKNAKRGKQVKHHKQPRHKARKGARPNAAAPKPQ